MKKKEFARQLKGALEDYSGAVAEGFDDVRRIVGTRRDCGNSRSKASGYMAGFISGMAFASVAAESFARGDGWPSAIVARACCVDSVRDAVENGTPFDGIVR